MHNFTLNTGAKFLLHAQSLPLQKIFKWMTRYFLGFSRMLFTSR
jgi:hypothetical protein